VGDAYEITVGADGVIVGFLCSAVSRAVFTGTSTYSKTPIEALWTPEVAISKARGFYEIVINNFPPNLGVPTAKFVQTKVFDNRYEPARWRVVWPRIDSVGRVFDDDRVTVELFEDYGGYFVESRLVANFSELKTEPIGREQAIAIALKGARAKIEHSGMLTTLFGSGLLRESPVGADLKIVRPNDFLATDNMQTAKRSFNARVCWVCVFPWIVKVGSPRYLHGISVWVDAESSTCIGGDAF